MIFVAYLSALCRNPLHTATQYALLTALAAFGRTYLSSGAGYRRGGDRLGLVLRDLRAGRGAGPGAARVAAAARTFRELRGHTQRQGKRMAISPSKRCSADRRSQRTSQLFQQSERRALPDRRRQRALVEIVELAADRHAMREPRHLHIGVGKQVGDVMRGGLAIDRGVEREDDLRHRRHHARARPARRS